MNTFDVAKDIVFLCRKYKLDFNNTKVQKLLYLIFGFALVNNITPTESIGDVMSVINEEPRAWPYGPVFPTVYERYNEIINNVDDNNYKLSVSSDVTLTKIVEETVKQWGKNNATALSNWSHKDGSPWSVVVNQDGSGWNTIIPEGVIREYFELNVLNILDGNV